MTNLIAHTEPSHPYPAYLSVNERDGGVEVSVRSRGEQGPSVIHLTPDAWFRLVVQAAAKAGLIPPQGELS